jgi:hypothetical protein
VAFQQNAVAQVKKLHQQTMRLSARRGPMRSPSQPPGIWNRAYPQLKADRIQAVVTVVKPNSC